MLPPSTDTEVEFDNRFGTAVPPRRPYILTALVHQVKNPVKAAKARTCSSGDGGSWTIGKPIRQRSGDCYYSTTCWNIPRRVAPDRLEKVNLLTGAGTAEHDGSLDAIVDRIDRAVEETASSAGAERIDNFRL